MEYYTEKCIPRWNTYYSTVVTWAASMRCLGRGSSKMLMHALFMNSACGRKEYKGEDGGKKANTKQYSIIQIYTCFLFTCHTIPSFTHYQEAVIQYMFWNVSHSSFWFDFLLPCLFIYIYIYLSCKLQYCQNGSTVLVSRWNSIMNSC